MDPNKLLQSIRERLKETFNDSAFRKREVSDQEYFLAQDIDDLDTWLSQGGFLPKSWDKTHA